jgi:hypothetical protein
VSVPEGHEPRLVRYLLGDLPEAEQEVVEAAYVVEGAAFEKLLAAEEDLIDAYVAGALSEPDRRRFEEHFLASPARRERVAFARALAARAAPEPPRVRRVVAWLWLPAAAVLAISLAGGVVLFSRVRQLGAELAGVRAGHEAALRAGEESQRRATDLDLELRRLRERRGAESAPAAPWVLAPGLERSGGAALGRPVTSGWVRLHLPLEADEFPRYRATVQTPDGATVARFERLRAQASGAARVVEIMVPAAALDQDVYVVSLAGIPARGAAEEVASYPLRVGR